MNEDIQKELSPPLVIPLKDQMQSPHSPSKPTCIISTPKSLLMKRNRKISIVFLSPTLVIIKCAKVSIILHSLLLILLLKILEMLPTLLPTLLQIPSRLPLILLKLPSRLLLLLLLILLKMLLRLFGKKPHVCFLLCKGYISS